MTTNEEKVKV